MLRYYIKLAIRSIGHHVGINLLNVVGLTVGLIITLVLGAYISNEYSFDRFHKNSSNIFQFWAKQKFGSNVYQLSNFSAGTAEYLKDKYSQIESSVRIKNAEKAAVNNTAGVKYMNDNVIFSEPGLFEIFSFPLTAGKSSELQKPNTVIITEETSRKFFGSQNAIGKVLVYNNELNLEVVGIASNVPLRSSITFDMVISLETLRNPANAIYDKHFGEINFAGGVYQTYFLLGEKTDPAALSKLIQPEKQLLIDLSDYHFESLKGLHVRNFGGDRAGLNYTLLFSLVASLSLILALLNYVNVTTAHYVERSSEITIRKINGATKYSIISQFYVESGIVTFISFVLAFGISWTMLPTFQSLLFLNFDKEFFISFQFLATIVLIFLACVIVGGLYPAILLSNTKPINSLSSAYSQTRYVSGTRRIMTIFQFTISTGLVLTSIIIQNQLNFLSNKKLGLTTQQILVFPLDVADGQKYPVLKDRLNTVSGVLSVGASTVRIFKEDFVMSVLAHRVDSVKDITVGLMRVDAGFARTLNLEWKEKSILKKGYILNETAVHGFSLLNKAVGSKIVIAQKETDVVGVIKDFNYASLRNRVDNLAIQILPDPAEFVFTGCSVYVKLETGTSLEKEINDIKAIYNGVSTGSSFEYYFLDDAFNQTYQSEKSLLSVFKVFTIAAIAIACFGLIGLLMFNISHRTKELSIRKILGATVANIYLVLSKETFLIVVTSVIISFPVVIYVLSDWLNAFPYRTTITASFLILAAVIVLFASIATTSYFVIRATRISPLKFLRK